MSTSREITKWEEKTYQVILTDEKRGGDRGEAEYCCCGGERWPEGVGERGDGGESEEGEGYQVESEATESG